MWSDNDNGPFHSAVSVAESCGHTHSRASERARERARARRGEEHWSGRARQPLALCGRFKVDWQLLKSNANLILMLPPAPTSVRDHDTDPCLLGSLERKIGTRARAAHLREQVRELTRLSSSA